MTAAPPWIEGTSIADYASEVGPFYCPAGCAADDSDTHEPGCEMRCSEPGCKIELSAHERKAGVCIGHDDGAPGYTSRGDAHLMAVTAPGGR